MDALNLDQLRDTYGLSPIRRGYQTFEGYTMPESFRHMRKAIEDFKVYDDDIWVTSYPKCGSYTFLSIKQSKQLKIFNYISN